MSLAVTVLGGAAAWPNPGQGCSSFLVKSASTAILLDSGPNTLLELRKQINYSTVDAIFISHCHSDHILDLVPYRYGLVYGPEKPDRPIPLWLPPGGTATLAALAQALGGKGEETSGFWESAFDAAEYQPDVEHRVDDLTVAFCRTEHAAECYAMRIVDSDGKVVGYTADTGNYQGLLDFMTGADILIAEGTMPEDEDRPSAGHLKPSEAGMLAAAANVGQLVISHLWAERPDDDVLTGASKHYSGHIQTAKPGETIHV